jgi:hypothetical protein
VAEAVAIVSVVSGAVVAVGVPFINARLERAKVIAQAEGARLDELRSVLDGAAVSLGVARSTIADFIEATAREAEPWSPPAVDAVDKAQLALRELGLWRRRLAIGLGPDSPTYIAYADFVDAFRARYVNPVWLARRNNTPFEDLPGEELLEPDRRFASEASQLIGVSLSRRKWPTRGRGGV